MKKSTKVVKTSFVIMLLLCSWCSSFSYAQAKSTQNNSRVIVIDPAFQEKADNDKEPIGPGAYAMCPEATTGNVGANTGCAEYELTLDVAKKVQENLEEQGYTVLLTRDSNDVNISNSGRAMIANVADADLMVVISTRDSGNDGSGVSVVCQSDDNPYNYGNYSDGRLLSDAIFGSMRSNCNGSEVVESDDVAVMNWCASPSTVVEIGSVEDAEDEEMLVTDEYQQQLANGIAAGVDSYFAQK